ncbi:hypothetical protein H0H93_008028 [Arthromyces matolae]|nr:hypothetical protein H0H93_008028 [Arthromyces matolae]
MEKINEDLLFVTDEKTGKKRKATQAEIRAKLPELTEKDKVPIPKIQRLTRSLPGTGKRLRSETKQLNELTKRAHCNAENFLKYADKFKLPFSIDDLTPKLDCKSLQDQVDVLVSDDYPVQALSAQFYDKDDKPYQDWEKQFEGRTEADVEKLRREGTCLVNDGLTDDQVKRYHETVQLLASKKQPVVKLNDKRHLLTSDNPRVMRYETDVGTEEDQDPILKQERCGVYHLVHAWIQQAKIKDGLYISDGLTGSGVQVTAVHNHYTRTADIFIYISAMFEKIYPETYSKYKKAFKAGKWVEEDPGVFLGRAIVYKLQIFPHFDDGDEGPAVSFPCGYYEGGKMIVPQLKAKFLYNPGAVCMFEAYRIYHAITRWTPMIMEEDDTLTPGRIGTVLFCPKHSVDILKDQEPDWGRRTDFGRELYYV